MKPPDPRAELHRYRTGYLKLKSVLFDRTTGLPAFPVLFDDLRRLLETRRHVGVLHFEIVDLELVESLYGWQVFDRIVGRVSRTLEQARGESLPQGSMLAVNGVAGGRFVAFVPQQPDGSEADEPFLGDVAEALCGALRTVFDDDEFAGLSPRLRFRAGHSLLALNPFYRFERCVYGAVDEAHGFHARRERGRELSWGEELRTIIQESAVETVFQPIVELRDRVVLGHEAFVRGPRDSLFEMPRAMFELSTRVGVAGELDRMCFETALTAFAGLGARGKVFVNALPASFAASDWTRSGLRYLLRSLQLRPSDIVVEISERLVDTDHFCELLAALKAEGFGLALDDVGTGRVRVDAIEQSRPHYLKLDVSLVRNIHRNLIKQEVLRTLVKLAQRIDATIVAEGVESEAECATLVEAGAECGQGFLFGVPSAPDSGMLGRTAGQRGH